MTTPVDNLLRFNCTGCGKRIKSPPQSVGKKVRCPRCGLIVTVTAAAPQASAESQALAPHEVQVEDAGTPLHKPPPPPPPPEAFEEPAPPPPQRPRPIRTAAPAPRHDLIPTSQFPRSGTRTPLIIGAIAAVTLLATGGFIILYWMTSGAPKPPAVTYQSNTSPNSSSGSTQPPVTPIAQPPPPPVEDKPSPDAAPIINHLQELAQAAANDPAIARSVSGLTSSVRDWSRAKTPGYFPYTAGPAAVGSPPIPLIDAAKEGDIQRIIRDLHTSRRDAIAALAKVRLDAEDREGAVRIVQRALEVAVASPEQSSTGGPTDRDHDIYKLVILLARLGAIDDAKVAAAAISPPDVGDAVLLGLRVVAGDFNGALSSARAIADPQKRGRAFQAIALGVAWPVAPDSLYDGQWSLPDAGSPRGAATPSPSAAGR